MTSRLLARWDEFWFAPASTSPLALFRIAYGTIIVVWAISVGPAVLDLYGPDGAFPEHPDRTWWHGLFQLFPSEAAVLAAWAILLVAAVCLTVGWRSRLASFLTWILLLSFMRRNPHAQNGGDRVIIALGFLLMLAPSGAALSVDRWRRARDRFWEMPLRAPWALRLLQLQVAVIYFFSTWTKIRHDAWSEGRALYYAWNIGETARLKPPSWIVDNAVIVNLLTWGALGIEAALAVLVWNRRLRPHVLLMGVALHVAIEVSIMIGFFSFIMIASYLVFVPGDAADQVVAAARTRWLERSRSAAAHGGTGVDEVAPALPSPAGRVPRPARSTGLIDAHPRAGAETSPARERDR